MSRVYVALGSNVGDRAAYLALGRARLATLPLTQLLAVSTVDETAPLGPVPQGPYLNQMALLETGLGPEALLRQLLEIETAAGRVRAPGTRWGPRTLDLDIVRIGDLALATADLTVPHPELPRRDFWQREMTQLDATVLHE